MFCTCHMLGSKATRHNVFITRIKIQHFLGHMPHIILTADVIVCVLASSFGIGVHRHGVVDDFSSY